MFPCVLLNLWSQQKTNPYRKTTFINVACQILRLSLFINNFILFYEIISFTKRIHRFYRRQILIAKPRLCFYFFKFYTFYIFINKFIFFVKSFALLNKCTEDKSLSQNHVYIFFVQI